MCLYACVRLYGGATVFHRTARAMGRMLVRLSTCRPFSTVQCSMTFHAGA